VLIFIFLINSTNADITEEAVSVRYNSVEDVVLTGRPAVFDVEITNLKEKGEIKSIVTDSNWRKESDYGFYNLDSGAKIKDIFKFYPIGFLQPGKYSINVRTYSINKPEEFVDTMFIVSVVPYRDLIEAKLDYNPQGLNPNKDNLITLKLRNRQEINLEELDVKIRSEIINQDIKTDISKAESKDFPFNVNLGNIEEGNYEINIFALYNNNIVANITQMVKVGIYSDVKEIKKEEFSFLIKTSEITKQNNGNNVAKEIYTKTFTSFENLFTKVSPEPSNIEKLDGAYKYTWKFNLNPSDSYFILVKTNYGKPVLILLLIILLIYLIYRRNYAGLTIIKKVLLLKSKEGNIAGLKILLVLKNAGNVIKNIRITDTIPGVLELPHEYGTLKPNSTRQGVSGSIVVWEIRELLRGEERVIAYKMKSKVTNLGNLTIPRANCNYKDNSGKFSIVKSNSPII
jgi:hypothetical protein